MLVDARSFEVRGCAPELLCDAAGVAATDVERGETAWSNELVAHVIELKAAAPVSRLESLLGPFQRDISEINTLLSRRGARLMPAGMHPAMDPARETRLWPGEGREIYEKFDALFDCRRHGWANLQSVHLNLPFSGDGEFGRLHAAVRLLLPLLPALAASSPIVEGRRTGRLDTRLEVYLGNAAIVPSLAGRVIPEAVYTKEAYLREILEPAYRDLAPRDPEGILRHEWINARGAIARFSRSTIEIRVLDVQECPLADLAICAAAAGVLEMLVTERWTDFQAQQAQSLDSLAQILAGTSGDGEQAVIEDGTYLAHLGLTRRSLTAREVWQRLIERLFEEEAVAAEFRAPLEVILQAGPLARRMLQVVAPGSKSAAPVHSGERLDGVLVRSLCERLCDCLAAGRMFVP
jgi:gamma-glutamyl:cysteine ligase YbdK (ATP-grasp superfamily)